jgi:16S rRNA (guanine527-N7)-methyltransferase
MPRISESQLTSQDLSNISTYIDILQRWNTRINLTAIRKEEEIVTRHFGESFFAAAQIFPARSPTRSDEAATNSRPTVADLGSGAGFPGFPIKLWASGISLTLIESNHKKATFLREVARSLKLTDINVVNARAEEITQQFDFVTLRAVERFGNVLPIAIRILKFNGRLALLISKSQLEQACSHRQVKWLPPIPIPQSNSRVLSIGEMEQRL